MNNEIKGRVRASLLAGTVAIAVNTVGLAASSRFGIATAHGGLLKFCETLLFHLMHLAGLEHTAFEWPSGAFGKTVFHVAVGYLMAFVYGVWLAHILKGSPLKKGLSYGAALWALNALVVLPLVGEGIAGTNEIGTIGVASFALIHTSFFVILALVYEQINRSDQNTRCIRPAKSS